MRSNRVGICGGIAAALFVSGLASWLGGCAPQAVSGLDPNVLPDADKIGGGIDVEDDGPAVDGDEGEPAADGADDPPPASASTSDGPNEPAAAPPYALSTDTLNFGDELSFLTLELTPAENQTVTFTLSSDADWLQFLPASGTVSGPAATIEVSLDRDALPAGLHAAPILVEANNGAQRQIMALAFQPDVPTVTSDEQIVEWLSELEPLPKTHYSFAFPGAMLNEPVDSLTYQLAYEYLRITGAFTFNVYSVRLDNTRRVLNAFEQIDALYPDRPCRLALKHSPWHHMWPRGLPPTDFGPDHDAEIEYFRSNLAQARSVIDQVNSEKGMNTEISVIFFDTEIFRPKSPDEPGASEWNAAIDAKYNAFYNIAKTYFPDIIVDWYQRGARYRCKANDGWCDRTWFTGNELGDGYGSALYTLPEFYAMQQTYTRTAEAALAAGYSRVTPWVALGAGYQRSLEDAFTFTKNWDYHLWYSWQIGAELNHPWFAGNPERFAPWDHAEYVMFYPRPFEPPHWGKHFVAYVRGAHLIRSLPE